MNYGTFDNRLLGNLDYRKFLIIFKFSGPLNDLRYAKKIETTEVAIKIKRTEIVIFREN